MIINTHSVILKKWNVSFNFIEEMCRIVFLSEIQKKNEHMLAWDYSLKTKLEVGETDLNTYLYVKDFFYTPSERDNSLQLSGHLKLKVG